MTCENLSAFFSDFGETVTVKREGQVFRTFTAIFDNPDLSGRVGTIATLARERLLLCAEKDAAGLLENNGTVAPDILKIRDVQHVILESHPDGTGLTVLYLATA